MTQRIIDAGEWKAGDTSRGKVSALRVPDRSDANRAGDAWQFYTQPVEAGAVKWWWKRLAAGGGIERSTFNFDSFRACIADARVHGFRD